MREPVAQERQPGAEGALPAEAVQEHVGALAMRQQDVDHQRPGIRGREGHARLQHRAEASACGGGVRPRPFLLSTVLP
ncbi:hypothetical protein NB693_22750 [Pantoea ananatis]|nr:hypothetical protein [Pantoea ananatis]